MASKATATQEQAPGGDWHTRPAHEVAAGLGVDVEEGLGPDQVARRLEGHGRNALEEMPPTPLWRRIAGLVTEPMTIVLVPADGRLVQTAGMEVQESALTGESAAVPKNAGAIDELDASLGDRDGIWRHRWGDLAAVAR